MHYYVDKERGPAKMQICIDCGKPAQDWSRRHGTDDEKDPSTFDPRCRRCHMAYDDHKRGQRGRPLPDHVQEAARKANIGNRYNVGRLRPDNAARNRSRRKSAAEGIDS